MTNLYFGMERYGPSRRRGQNAPAALRIFLRHPKKTFATISARTGLPEMSALRSLTGVDRTWLGQPISVEKDPLRTFRALLPK